MSEAKTQNEIRLALGRDATLFRNNVGTGWTGNITRLQDGSILIKNPRPLHAGLCKGSSDLIGWRSITITPDMIGQKVAVFSAVEVKAQRGRATPDQINFITKLVSDGGLGVIAKNADEAKMGLAITVK